MNKKLLILIAFISAVLMFSLKTNAQICQNLDAGDDVQMQCTDTDVTLNANYIVPTFKSTRNYVVNGNIDCPPIPHQGQRANLNIDDRWIDFVIDLPFTFCFYDNQYDQILVSSNGVVTFDLTVQGDYQSYVINPNLTLPTQEWQTNAIFAPYTDMDPSEASSLPGRDDRIVAGVAPDTVAPNRQFIISWEEGLYNTDLGCGTNIPEVKSKIILYETSNVIDIVIDQKPSCTGWPHSERAVVGIQNKSGTLGVSPVGRENGSWEPPVGGEVWRFVPDGDNMQYTLNWYDQDGNLLNANNEESITVNPQEETIYTAELTLFENCENNTTILTDEVTVTPGFTPDIQTPVNLVECEDVAGSGTFDFDIDQTTYVLNGLNAADYIVTYYNNFADADAATNAITVLNPYNSAGNETIFIRVEDATDATCYTIRSFTLTVLPKDDASFDYPANQYCNDDTNPLPTNVVTTPGSFEINNGGTIDSTTGEIDLSTSGLGTDGTGNFTITYTTSADCPNSSTFDITIELRKDASFDYPTNVCIADANPQATVTEVGGTFSVDGGATINTSTGELDLSTTTEGADYLITYQFTGNCQSSSQQSIHINESPTATAPTTILNSCDNGNGTANFDILSIENEIIGSQTGVTVTYHATEADAEAGVNTLDTTPFLIVSGNAWARVENSQGCIAVVEIPLTIENCIIIIPQGFSPNSNIPENQVFNIPGIRAKYPKFELYVYNRYGNEVYSGNINTDDWNGKLNNKGDLLPSGTYFYGLKLNDDQDIQYRGWVYLNY